MIGREQCLRNGPRKTKPAQQKQECTVRDTVDQNKQRSSQVWWTSGLETDVTVCRGIMMTKTVITVVEDDEDDDDDDDDDDS